MGVRFYNCRMLCAKTGEILEDVQVIVEGDAIESVNCKGKEADAGRRAEGSPDALPAGKKRFEREIDCQGDLLMPGFKDAHAHSPMVVFRSLADDVALDVWLKERIFPAEARLTPKDMTELTKLAVLEYLSGGITAVADMYLNPEAVSEACIQMGMRCVNVGGVNDFTLSVPLMERHYAELNAMHPLISYRLGFHAEYTTGEAILKGVAALSHKYGEPVYAHLSETQKEVQDCLRRTGKTPPAYLADLGIFDYGGGGYHCVHVSEEDMDILLEKKLFAVTNPASNLKLASGVAPVARFLERGIPVAIGTDGAASNNCLDMFREMFLVTGLAKERQRDASAVDAAKVLAMAVSGGAYAMGLWDCDAVAPGKKADLILIDLHKPNMQPLHNLAKNVVYSGSKSNVRLTMVNGKILYENGTYPGADIEKIYDRAARISGRVNGAGLPAGLAN